MKPLSKRELENMRRRDCDRKRNKTFTKLQFGPQPKTRHKPRDRRAKPRSGYSKFILAIPRYRTLQEAAAAAKVNYGTHRNALRRDTRYGRQLQSQVADGKAEYLFRQLQMVAKGERDRLNLTPGMAKLILRAIEKREMALCVEGAAEELRA